MTHGVPMRRPDGAQRTERETKVRVSQVYPEERQPVEASFGKKGFHETGRTDWSRRKDLGKGVRGHQKYLQKVPLLEEAAGR